MPRIPFNTLVILVFISLWVFPAGAHESFSEDGELSPLMTQGRSLFLHYCAHCHGVNGDGDGYNAEQLEKEPAELSESDFISKKSNKQIFRVVKFGGSGVKKSHLMPAFGYTLSEQEIWSLVAYVRHLAGDEDHPVVVPAGTSKARPANPPYQHDSPDTFRQWLEVARASQIGLGEKIFRKGKSCLACHQLDEEGGIVGPDLSRAGDLYPAEWIFSWVGNPQRIKPHTVMPNLGLTNEECRAVTVFLSSLKGESLENTWANYLDLPGDPDKGKKLFFDSEGKANCAKCHTVNGRGGKVGPPLSYVGASRTRKYLVESILNPKAVIATGYSSILILTRKGKFITGVKVNEDDSSIDLVDKEGGRLHILKSEIKKFKTQKISIMPGNFKDILSEEEVRNLLAYLSTLQISN